MPGSVEAIDCRGLGGRRLVAYLLDWLVGLVAGWLLVLAAGAVLLLASDLDRRDPPNSALYAALCIVAAWLPLWLLYTALAWGWRGATAGMAVMGLAVVDRAGHLPGVWRAALRAVMLVLLSLPLLLAPALIALAIAYGSPGPISVWLPFLLFFVLSTLACGRVFLPAGSVTWHDQLSGTRVVAPGRGKRQSGCGGEGR